MRKQKRILGVALAALGLVVASVAPVEAHPGQELDGSENPLKGVDYDGVVDEISPGGVPMEALSDERCTGGMAAGLFPCHKVDLDAFVPLPDLEATFLNDLWGWEDSQTGQQIAIAGTFEGTAFVDVTDGKNPVYLGTLESASPGDSGNIWGDVRVYGDAAYIVSEAIDVDAYIASGGTVLPGFGMQVVDLTQFRGATGPGEVELAEHVTDMTNAHNVSVNEDSGRLYVVGSVYALEVCQTGSFPVNGNGGAIVYDVSGDPLNPTFIGCMTDDGYSHDITCVTYDGPDEAYHGHEICVGSNEDYVTLYDATDIDDVEILASVAGYYPDGLAVGDIYTHQGWMSEDHSYFFLGDELDEIEGVVGERTTYIWDLSDLDDPVLVGSHSDGNTSIDHNMFVLEGLLYQANYTAGLTVYDAWKADKGRLTERAFFDVFPANDDTSFAGSWGNYPYFGDGKVIVTSSDEGLFILNSRAKSSNNDFRPGVGNGNGRR